MSHHSTSIELGIDGMDCSGCAAGIERRLKAIGIDDAVVSYSTSTAHFSLPDPSALPRIMKEIEKLGYQPHSGEHGTSPHSWWTVQRKFVFCLVFTLPLLLHMFLPFPLLHDPYVQLILCLPVFVVSIFHFGMSAYRSIRGGVANMDVLIIIGVVSAFGYSLYGTLLGLGENFLFYETAATITTIVLLGNLMEERAVRKTTSSIAELSAMQPHSARRVRGSGALEQIEEVNIEALQEGDILLIVEGDRIPVDGSVVNGHGSVDESIITGESVPVDKTVGDPLVGGTSLSVGNLRMRTEAIGQDTVLSNMVRLVRQAQLKKPSIQRIGDQVSAVFVPIVVLIAVCTFIASWGFAHIDLQESILRSIAVLVVACPCAMGLATPTAVMVGIGQAARRGILIKGGDTLERLAGVRHIIFDKTGTLTSGAFRVNDLRLFEASDSEVKAAIHGLELRSTHPIAVSLREAFKQVPALQYSTVEETRGVGMRGTTPQGDTYELRTSSGTHLSREADLVLLKNEVIIAALKLGDDIKPEAQQVMSALHRADVSTALLSGDRREKCEQVAKNLGMKDVYFEKRPEEKLQILQSLEHARPSAFVGDGINDAPTLAAARVGISLSNASHIAVQSAQVVLLNGNLELLPQSLGIARSTLKIIKQNLFWAFFYNCLGIPLAAMGMLSPIFGALAMAFSDLIVIGNSLRLRSHKVAEL